MCEIAQISLILFVLSVACSGDSDESRSDADVDADIDVDVYTGRDSGHDIGPDSDRDRSADSDQDRDMYQDGDTNRDSDSDSDDDADDDTDGGYHFSNSTGNDTTGDGSRGNPWRSISKLNSTDFTAGDRIYLKRGDTWAIGPGESGIEIDFNGNSENVITIAAYGTGAMPVIDASAQTGDGERGNGASNVCVYFTGSGGDYVVIDGIETRGATNESCFDGYNKSLSNTTIRNCMISGSGWEAEALIRMDGDYIRIENNTLDGLGNSYSKGIEISGGDYCVISENELIDLASGGGAIRIVHGNYCVIDSNYIYGVSAPQSNHWAIVPRDPDQADSWNVISNNLIDLSSSDYTGDNVIGLNTWNATGEPESTIKIFNNTFIGNGSGSAMKVQQADSVRIYNNILYNYNYYVEVDDSCGVGAVDFQHNAYYICPGGTDIEEASDYVDGGHNQTADPLLAGASFTSSDDFRLRTGSPCINAGTTGGGDPQIPTDDYWGTTRTAIDIGAHEYE